MDAYKPTSERAYRVGRIGGRPVYRVPVSVSVVDTDTLSERRRAISVLAWSAADAANWARDRMADVPNTNIRAIGPQGGVVTRFIGWESAIGARMFASRGPVQCSLFLEGN